MLQKDKSNMTFVYRAVTANCGNDHIGTKASETIANLLSQNESVDFIVLNCQETDFKSTQSQLEKVIAKHGYKIDCLAKMVTHTKPSTQLHSRTGLATFLIYKQDLKVQVDNSVTARRNQQRFAGSSYNKGGIVTEFTVTRQNQDQEECIKLQSICGHLDSKKPNARGQDWLNLHKASSNPRVERWEDLVRIYPQLKISGYDANVRHKIEEGAEINLLVERPNDPEVQFLSKTPLADRHYTATITYSKTNDESILDSKRVGYAARGALDYIGIADGSKPHQQRIITEDVIKIDPEKSTARDHAVLISPVQNYVFTSEFEVVKNHMASHLHGVAPQLAQRVRLLSSTPQSQESLLDIYNQFLSIDGLVNGALNLHIKKLETYQRLQSRNLPNNLLGKCGEILFQDTPWCDGLASEVMTRQVLMLTLLDYLEQCYDQDSIEARLCWFSELTGKLKNDVVMDPVQAFKNNIINEYSDIRNCFAQALKKKNLNEEARVKIIAAGLRVLECMDNIFNPFVDDQSSIDVSNLEKLMRIALHGIKLLEACENHSESVDSELQLLDRLSQEISTKTSFLWKMLRTVLSGFVQLVAAFTGVSLEFKLISKEEIAKVQLADSLQAYHLAIHGFFERPDVNFTNIHLEEQPLIMTQPAPH